MEREQEIKQKERETRLLNLLLETRDVLFQCQDFIDQIGNKKMAIKVRKFLKETEEWIYPQ